MEFVLSTDKLTKSYGAARAVDAADMRVPKGGIYGFVGKNGAGKTTVIRMICGLTRPTSGSYSLYGAADEAGNVLARRRMGAVVETPSLYPTLTARDNIAVQRRVLGMPPGGADEILRAVRLEGAGKKKVKDFSLGMKQRLGIAVALLGSPDFLVLDEPANGLDPEGIMEMRELLLGLNREKGITVLISSHILPELALLATHYGFIDRGRILREISAAELESSFRKTLVLDLSSTRGAPEVLAGVKNVTSCKILSPTRVELATTAKAGELVAALSAAGIEVLSMNTSEKTLENYFMDLIGGRGNA